MAKTQTIEIVPEDLGNEPPVPGCVRVIKGVRCRILDVVPPASFSSKSGGRVEDKAPEKWRLVVEVSDEESPAPGPEVSGTESPEERGDPAS